MNNDGSTMQEAAGSEVILSSPAWELMAGATFAGKETAGTLALSKSGRLTFTLKSGTVAFSAPVSLIRYKPGLGSLALVAGDRRFSIALFESDISGMLSPTYMTMRSIGARKQTQAWRAALDQHASMPADNEPLIVMNQQRSGAQMMKIIGTLLAIVVTCLGVGILSAMLLPKDYAKLGAAIAIALLVGAFIMINRRKAQALVEKNQGSSASPSEILPAGTTPSVDFAFSVKHPGLTALLAFVGVIVGIFVVIFLVLIMIAIFR
jgi:hypothetical protein